METPRLRNSLNLYLGGYLTKVRPNTFEALRENILLDCIARNNLSNKLDRLHSRLLSLIPVNKDNKDLETAKEVSEQINAVAENNENKFIAYIDAHEKKLEQLVKTFEILEKSGILNK